jgi:hypothetical protein
MSFLGLFRWPSSKEGDEGFATASAPSTSTAKPIAQTMSNATKTTSSSPPSSSSSLPRVSPRSNSTGHSSSNTASTMSASSAASTTSSSSTASSTSLDDVAFPLSPGEAGAKEQLGVVAHVDRVCCGNGENAGNLDSLPARRRARPPRRRAAPRRGFARNAH